MRGFPSPLRSKSETSHRATGGSRIARRFTQESSRYVVGSPSSPRTSPRPTNLIVNSTMISTFYSFFASCFLSFVMAICIMTIDHLSDYEHLRPNSPPQLASSVNGRINANGRSALVGWWHYADAQFACPSAISNGFASGVESFHTAQNLTGNIAMGPQSFSAACDISGIDVMFFIGAIARAVGPTVTTAGERIHQTMVVREATVTNAKLFYTSAASTLDSSVGRLLSPDIVNPDAASFALYASRPIHIVIEDNTFQFDYDVTRIGVYFTGAMPLGSSVTMRRNTFKAVMIGTANLGNTALTKGYMAINAGLINTFSDFFLCSSASSGGFMNTPPALAAAPATLEVLLNPATIPQAFLTISDNQFDFHVEHSVGVYTACINLRQSAWDNTTVTVTGNTCSLVAQNVNATGQATDAKLVIAGLYIGSCVWTNASLVVSSNAIVMNVSRGIAIRRLAFGPMFLETLTLHKVPFILRDNSLQLYVDSLITVPMAVAASELSSAIVHCIGIYIRDFVLSNSSSITVLDNAITSTVLNVPADTALRAVRLVLANIYQGCNISISGTVARLHAEGVWDVFDHGYLSIEQFVSIESRATRDAPFIYATSIAVSGCTVAWEVANAARAQLFAYVVDQLHLMPTTTRIRVSDSRVSLQTEGIRNSTIFCFGTAAFLLSYPITVTNISYVVDNVPFGTLRSGLRSTASPDNYNNPTMDLVLHYFTWMTPLLASQNANFDQNWEGKIGTLVTITDNTVALRSIRGGRTTRTKASFVHFQDVITIDATARVVITGNAFVANFTNATVSNAITRWPSRRAEAAGAVISASNDSALVAVDTLIIISLRLPGSTRMIQIFSIGEVLIANNSIVVSLEDTAVRSVKLIEVGGVYLNGGGTLRVFNNSMRLIERGGGAEERGVIGDGAALATAVPPLSARVALRDGGDINKVFDDPLAKALPSPPDGSSVPITFYDRVGVAIDGGITYHISGNVIIEANTFSMLLEAVAFPPHHRVLSNASSSSSSPPSAAVPFYNPYAAIRVRGSGDSANRYTAINIPELSTFGDGSLLSIKGTDVRVEVRNTSAFLSAFGDYLAAGRPHLLAGVSSSAFRGGSSGSDSLAATTAAMLSSLGEGRGVGGVLSFPAISIEGSVEVAGSSFVTPIDAVSRLSKGRVVVTGTRLSVFVDYSDGGFKAATSAGASAAYLAKGVRVDAMTTYTDASAVAAEEPSLSASDVQRVLAARRALLAAAMLSTAFGGVVGLGGGARSSSSLTLSKSGWFIINDTSVRVTVPIYRAETFGFVAGGAARLDWALYQQVRIINTRSNAFACAGVGSALIDLSRMQNIFLSGDDTLFSVNNFRTLPPVNFMSPSSSSLSSSYPQPLPSIATGTDLSDYASLPLHRAALVLFGGTQLSASDSARIIVSGLSLDAEGEAADGANYVGWDAGYSGRGAELAAVVLFEPFPLPREVYGRYGSSSSSSSVGGLKMSAASPPLLQVSFGDQSQLSVGGPSVTFPLPAGQQSMATVSSSSAGASASRWYAPTVPNVQLLDALAVLRVVGTNCTVTQQQQQATADGSAALPSSSIVVSQWLVVRRLPIDAISYAAQGAEADGAATAPSRPFAAEAPMSVAPIVLEGSAMACTRQAPAMTSPSNGSKPSGATVPSADGSCLVAVGINTSFLFPTLADGSAVSAPTAPPNTAEGWGSGVPSVHAGIVLRGNSSIRLVGHPSHVGVMGIHVDCLRCRASSTFGMVLIAVVGGLMLGSSVDSGAAPTVAFTSALRAEGRSAFTVARSSMRVAAVPTSAYEPSTAAAARYVAALAVVDDSNPESYGGANFGKGIGASTAQQLTAVNGAGGPFRGFFTLCGLAITDMEAASTRYVDGIFDDVASLGGLFSVMSASLSDVPRDPFLFINQALECDALPTSQTQTITASSTTTVTPSQTDRTAVPSLSTSITLSHSLGDSSHSADPSPSATYYENIQPEDIPMEPIREKSETAIVVGLLLGGGVFVSPSTGSQASVAMALLRVSKCSSPSSGGGDSTSSSSDDGTDAGDILGTVDSETDEPLSPFIHPLQFAVGSGPYRYYNGAIIGNCVVIPLAALVLLRGPLVWALQRWGLPDGPSTAEVLTYIGWPSVIVLPFVALAEGIAVSTTVLLGANSGGPAEALLGIVGAIVMAVLVIAWVFIVWMLCRLPTRRARSEFSGWLWSPWLGLFERVPDEGKRTLDNTTFFDRVYAAIFPTIRSPNPRSYFGLSWLTSSFASLPLIHSLPTSSTSTSTSSPSSSSSSSLPALIDGSLERWAHCIGDAWWLWCELACLLCSVVVGIVEGLQIISEEASGGLGRSDGSGGGGDDGADGSGGSLADCYSSVVLLFIGAVVQSLLALTTTVPAELLVQFVVAVCVILLALSALVAVIDGAADGDDGDASFLTRNDQEGLGFAINILGYFGLAVGFVCAAIRLLSDRALLAAIKERWQRRHNQRVASSRLLASSVGGEGGDASGIDIDGGVQSAEWPPPPPTSMASLRALRMRKASVLLLPYQKDQKGWAVHGGDGSDREDAEEMTEMRLGGGRGGELSIPMLDVHEGDGCSPRDVMDLMLESIHHEVKRAERRKTMKERGRGGGDGNVGMPATAIRRRNLSPSPSRASPQQQQGDTTRKRRRHSPMPSTSGGQQVDHPQSDTLAVAVSPSTSELLDVGGVLPDHDLVIDDDVENLEIK